MSNARAGSGGKLVVGLARQTVVGVAARFAVGVGRGARVTCSLLQKPPVFALGARVGVCALFTVRVLGLTGVGSIQMIWDAIVIIVVRRISEHLLFAGVLWSFYLLFVFGHEEGNKKQQVEEMRRKH